MKISKLISIILLIINTSTDAVSTLETEMLGSFVDHADYHAPSEKDIKLAQSLFQSILRDKLIKTQDITAWRNIGMNLKLVRFKTNDYAVISQDPQHTLKGYGFYIIKLNSPNRENILQAPHRLTDLYTDRIIFQLFIEGDYAAAAWNTTQRSSVDLCKEPKSFFNSFTIAAAITMKNPRIIQLHAFDSMYHNIDADLIISAATKFPQEIYANVANCLKRADSKTNLRILQYPREIQILGGTLNINAKNFYNNNSQALFFHVETNKSLRKDLENRRALRDQFTKCLTNRKY